MTYDARLEGRAWQLLPSISHLAIPAGRSAICFPVDDCQTSGIWGGRDVPSGGIFVVSSGGEFHSRAGEGGHWASLSLCAGSLAAFAQAHAGRDLKFHTAMNVIRSQARAMARLLALHQAASDLAKPIWALVRNGICGCDGCTKYDDPWCWLTPQKRPSRRSRPTMPSGNWDAFQWPIELSSVSCLPQPCADRPMPKLRPRYSSRPRPRPNQQYTARPDPVVQHWPSDKPGDGRVLPTSLGATGWTG